MYIYILNFVHKHIYQRPTEMLKTRAHSSLYHMNWLWFDLWEILQRHRTVVSLSTKNILRDKNSQNTCSLHDLTYEMNLCWRVRNSAAMQDSWEPLYQELAEGQKHVFKHDHKRIYVCVFCMCMCMLRMCCVCVCTCYVWMLCVTCGVWMFHPHLT